MLIVLTLMPTGPYNNSAIIYSGQPGDRSLKEPMGHDTRHPFFNFDDETMQHLVNEVPEPVRELKELFEIAEGLEDKVGRPMERIKSHMMGCGTCLSKQIADGTLVTIGQYWEADLAMGAGRLPKLHSTMN